MQVFVEENQEKDLTENDVVGDAEESTADKENNPEPEKVQS